MSQITPVADEKNKVTNSHEDACLLENGLVGIIPAGTTRKSELLNLVRVASEEVNEDDERYEGDAENEPHIQELEVGCYW